MRKRMSRRAFLGLGGIGAAALALGSSGALPGEAVAQAAGRGRPGAVINVAHRGASGTSPENTLAAISRGVQIGADFVEVDVQRSADGELILFHDPTLERTTDVEEVFPERLPYRTGDFTLAELRQLDAGSWFSPEFAGEGIPTLGEALPLLRGRSGLLLELKDPVLYPGIEEQVASEFDAAGFSRPAAAARRAVVQSFDLLSVQRYHRIQPNVPAGALFNRRPTELELQQVATYAAQVNPSFRVTDRSLVQSIQRLGMTTSVYTVNDPEEMRRMISLGVDGIITDFPEVLRELNRLGASG